MVFLLFCTLGWIRQPSATPQEGISVPTLQEYVWPKFSFFPCSFFCCHICHRLWHPVFLLIMSLEVHMLSSGWLQHFLPRELRISLSTSFHKFCILLGRGRWDCLPCCSCWTKFASVGFLSLHQLYKQDWLYQSHGRRALVFRITIFLSFQIYKNYFLFFSKIIFFSIWVQHVSEGSIMVSHWGANQPYLDYILKNKHVGTATSRLPLLRSIAKVVSVEGKPGIPTVIFICFLCFQPLAYLYT